MQLLRQGGLAGVLLVASGLAGRLVAVWPGRSDLRRVPGPVRGNPGRHLILTAPGGVSWRGPIQGVDDVPCRDLQLAPQLFEHSGGFVSGHVVGRCLGLAALSTSNAQRPDGERTSGYIALLRQLGVFARDCVDVMLLRG